MFKNLERRQASGRAHNAAPRVRSRPTHIKVLNGRAELRPAWHRSQKEKLLERKFALENISFAQPPLAFEIERRDHLLMENDVFDIRRVLGNRVDHIVAEGFLLIVPIETRTQ